MRKLFSISTLIIIIFLASCDIPSQKVVIPEQLSYPAWLEGSWYEKNPEYILIHAEGGDITCPIVSTTAQQSHRTGLCRARQRTELSQKTE